MFSTVSSEFPLNPDSLPRPLFQVKPGVYPDVTPQKLNALLQNAVDKGVVGLPPPKALAALAGATCRPPGGTAVLEARLNMVLDTPIDVMLRCV